MGESPSLATPRAALAELRGVTKQEALGALGDGEDVRLHRDDASEEADFSRAVPRGELELPGVAGKPSWIARPVRDTAAQLYSLGDTHAIIRLRTNHDVLGFDVGGQAPDDSEGDGKLRAGKSERPTFVPPQLWGKGQESVGCNSGGQKDVDATSAGLADVRRMDLEIEKTAQQTTTTKGPGSEAG